MDAGHRKFALAGCCRAWREWRGLLVHRLLRFSLTGGKQRKSRKLCS